MHESMPSPFPQPTLKIMRALCALRHIDNDDKRYLAVLDHLYAEFFVHHKETSKPDVLRKSLEAVLGVDEAARGEISLFPLFFLLFFHYFLLYLATLQSIPNCNTSPPQCNACLPMYLSWG